LTGKGSNKWQTPRRVADIFTHPKSLKRRLSSSTLQITWLDDPAAKATGGLAERIGADRVYEATGCDHCNKTMQGIRP
jgi:hypothetical protein